MEEKLLIIHGYSDGSVSFNALRDFFVKDAKFGKENVFHLDYASMDDDATFQDFADKLDADYTQRFKKERINVACHSTGALVVRAWLALRRQRQLQMGRPLDCPVKRILMFAPANFGSDLATMGQSMLGKVQATFFNRFSSKVEDFMESGRVVLQGLEPASPFQWDLSDLDLHGFDYFSSGEDPELTCFPFVLAAGHDYDGELQARVIKARRKPGTDGTVRICGTSLNTRKCLLNFRGDGRSAKAVWRQENKFSNIPFAIFSELNHATIIDAGLAAFRRRETGPKQLVLKALKVNTVQQYEALADEFGLVSKKNYRRARGRYKDHYQQFFFKVCDDTGRPVNDYYIDFYVEDRRGNVLCDLTEQFDEDLESKFYRHSEDPSCRVLMIRHKKMKHLEQLLVDYKARLMFDVVASSGVPNVSYKRGVFTVLDRTTGKAVEKSGEPSFLYPETTTLVDMVLNRVESDKLASLKDHDLKAVFSQRVRRVKASGRGHCR